MRKVAALVLSMFLAVSLAAAGAAEAGDNMSGLFDISCFEDNKEFFRTEVSEDGTTAYIQTLASAENRAFSTPYENDLYYSTVFPELMITGWDTETERTPLFRLWVRYRGTKHLNIGAVSFVIDGTDYRFLDVASPDWTATKEDGTAAQDMVLVLGANPVNATCFAALFSNAIEYTRNRLDDPETPQPDITMILHGEEKDMAVTLPADFWSELAMFAYNLDSINGFSFLTSTDGTPCIIQDK